MFIFVLRVYPIRTIKTIYLFFFKLLKILSFVVLLQLDIQLHSLF